jgi:hypothetical protein
LTGNVPSVPDRSFCKPCFRVTRAEEEGNFRVAQQHTVFKTTGAFFAYSVISCNKERTNIIVKECNFVSVDFNAVEINSGFSESGRCKRCSCNERRAFVYV